MDTIANKKGIIGHAVMIESVEKHATCGTGMLQKAWPSTAKMAAQVAFGGSYLVRPRPKVWPHLGIRISLDSRAPELPSSRALAPEAPRRHDGTQCPSWRTSWPRRRRRGRPRRPPRWLQAAAPSRLRATRRDICSRCNFAWSLPWMVRMLWNMEWHSPYSIAPQNSLNCGLQQGLALEATPPAFAVWRSAALFT